MSKNSSKVSRSPSGQICPTKKSEIIEHFRQCWQFHQIQEGLLAPQGGSKLNSYTSSCLKKMLLLWHKYTIIWSSLFWPKKIGKNEINSLSTAPKGLICQDTKKHKVSLSCLEHLLCTYILQQALKSQTRPEKSINVFAIADRQDVVMFSINSWSSKNMFSTCY